jgi:hypothetical protein
VTRLEAHNTDLRIAASRVEEARAGVSMDDDERLLVHRATYSS